jgi:two-component system, sensor histidine kinase and response regulator
MFQYVVTSIFGFKNLTKDSMSQKTVLVVDDSETNLLLFESMFENESRIKILLKNSGKNIIDYCIKNRPDLILLDLLMPEISGFEVLELLQSNIELKQIPVIIISALDGQAEIKRAIELGANDYIIKPIDFEENTTLILETLGLEK